MKPSLAILLPLLLAAMGFSCAPEPATGGPVRPPAVAGSFYPGNPNELRTMVDTFLADAASPSVEGALRVLIVPHAGYVYSGAVAAHAFKLLPGQSIRTVVLLGNSHRAGYPAAAVWPKGAFRTPLGDIPINEDFAARLLASGPPFVANEGPHAQEHSLEVELPFLQRTLGEFQLVPILLGTENLATAQAVGAALAAAADNETLVIASTDLSHYPAYPNACALDDRTLHAILAGDPAQFESTLRQIETRPVPQTDTLICGEGAVKATLAYARQIGATRGTLLKYANSGDTAGTKDRVVGYAALAFTGGELPPPHPDQETPMNPDENEFTPAERQALLDLARLTVETVATSRQRPAWTNPLPGLERKRGAFVTLRKNGHLRGCIGHFDANMPIHQTVIEMAIAAATQDHRFPPVSASELSELDYEISVLSPLRKIDDWRQIQLGKHGVQVARGFRRGVFLPQVATETGWNLDQFMGELCSQKAGLAPDAWKDPKTDLYVFTAEIFSDHE